MSSRPTPDDPPRSLTHRSRSGSAALSCDNCGRPFTKGYHLLNDDAGIGAEYVGADCGCDYFTRVVEGRECLQCRTEWLGKSSYGIDADGNVCRFCDDGVVREPVRWERV